MLIPFGSDKIDIFIDEIEKSSYFIFGIESLLEQ